MPLLRHDRGNDMASLRRAASLNASASFRVPQNMIYKHRSDMCLEIKLIISTHEQLPGLFAGMGMGGRMSALRFCNGFFLWVRCRGTKIVPHVVEAA